MELIRHQINGRILSFEPVSIKNLQKYVELFSYPMFKYTVTKIRINYQHIDTSVIKKYMYMLSISNMWNFWILFLKNQNHAKPLRESLTYYMLAHPFNELMPPETKNILRKHVSSIIFVYCCIFLSSIPVYNIF